MDQEKTGTGNRDAATGNAVRWFEEKLREADGPEARRLIGEAIDAIDRACEAIDALQKAPKPPAGAPKPGSEAELNEEIAKEKLDP